MAMYFLFSFRLPAPFICCINVRKLREIKDHPFLNRFEMAVRIRYISIARLLHFSTLRWWSHSLLCLYTSV